MKSKVPDKFFKTKLEACLKPPYTCEQRADFISYYNHEKNLYIEFSQKGISAWHFKSIKGYLTFCM